MSPTIKQIGILLMQAKETVVHDAIKQILPASPQKLSDIFLVITVLLTLQEV